jgi:hypothetical protein
MAAALIREKTVALKSMEYDVAIETAFHKICDVLILTRVKKSNKLQTTHQPQYHPGRFTSANLHQTQLNPR